MTLEPLDPRPARWRDLPPVDRPISIDDRRVSVTLLRTHDRCDRSAYLDLLHEGGPGSAEMNRGSIFHVFAAKATQHLIEQDEQQLAPESAKDLLTEALDEHPELTVPAGERDALRAMAYNFASGTFFTPSTVVGVELPMTLDLGGWQIRGRPDLVVQPHFGRLDVTDYKTSFSMPTTAEWEGDYQTMLYALMLAFGETDGGLRLGTEVAEFGLHLVFPRYLRDDGLASRDVTVTRQQLTDLRLDLEHQLARLDRNLETQEWPALPGKACAECVSPAECPLPRHLRPESQMALASIEDARKLAEWWYVEDARVKRAKARLRGWADRHGRRAIEVGRDRELAFVERSEFVSLDRPALAVEVEGAMEYGTPVDLDRLQQRRSSIRFEVRDREQED